MNKKKGSQKNARLEKYTGNFPLVESFSTASESSFAGIGPRKNSFEKVNSWLCGGNNPKKCETVCAKDGNIFDSFLEYDYPPIPNKLQTLLTYGEYSLFKKWTVLVEGDFVPLSTPAEMGQLSRRKIRIGEIRSLAVTKNWLIICNMRRLYQAERDGVVPAGVSLDIRRLVPLKYLRLFIPRPAQKVIGIQNQMGITKEYQLLEPPTPVAGDAFVAWRNVIGSLNPRHNDDTLFVTLQMFERWSRQHRCRITIYPGSQKQSNISLANWKVEKDSPPPKVVEKARTPTPEPPKPPTPPAPKPKTPSPPVSEPPFEYEYIAGHEASVGGNSPMTLSHKSDDIEGIETIVGPSRPMSPESPNAVMENPTPSSSQPNDPSKRRKKTVRSVFRMGLFLSRKNKRKPALSPDAGPTDEPTFNPAPRRHPMVQRRQSRLEMNEPIEDIFSDVKFETIEKIEESSSPNAEYDSDVIEDPDVVVMTSLLEKQASFPSDEAAGRDFVKFDDVTTDNVTTPSSNQDHEHWDDLT
nr:uncharacterized protein LOC100180884 isoform X1 [Ciona intestinalis]|eukprot:XP_026689784.1 uncharacterized protein LOC100180884 isoform X1 [Ciona intestinalis]